MIFVYAFSMNKHFNLYLPSTFQASDIELLSPKVKLHIHLTKSPKRDHVSQLRLYMLEEQLFSYTTICSSFKWIEPLFF